MIKLYKRVNEIKAKVSANTERFNLNNYYRQSLVERLAVENKPLDDPLKLQEIFGFELKQSYQCTCDYDNKCITLVDKSAFKSENLYLNFFIHEAIHFDGYRLKRKCLQKYKDWTKLYRAKEECVAQIAALTVSEHLGIVDDRVEDFTFSYLNSWNFDKHNLYHVFRLANTASKELIKKIEKKFTM